MARKRSRRGRRQRSRFRLLVKFGLGAAAFACGLTFLVIGLLRWLPPPTTAFMLHSRSADPASSHDHSLASAAPHASSLVHSSGKLTSNTLTVESSSFTRYARRSVGWNRRCLGPFPRGSCTDPFGTSVPSRLSTRYAKTRSRPRSTTKWTRP